MTNGAAGADGGGKKSSLATGVAIVVAILALAFFVLHVFYMQSLVRANVPELQWNRAVYLFGAIEALAFSAAGYLWGREVNRQRAEKAEARAEKTQEKAQKAESAAAEVVAKAKSLKEMVDLKAGNQSQKSQEYGSLGDQAEVATQTATKLDLQEVAAFAQRLFPEG